MLSNTKKSTPRADLEVMFDLIPIPLLIKREATSSFARNREALREETRSFSAQSHIRNCEQLAETWQLNKEDSDRTTYKIWEKLYEVEEKSYTTATKPMGAQINLYTDGSKEDEHTACGFTINRYNTERAANSIRSPNYTSVYQAEVLDIRLAMIPIRQPLDEEDRFRSKSSQIHRHKEH